MDVVSAAQMRSGMRVRLRAGITTYEQALVKVASAGSSNMSAWAGMSHGTCTFVSVQILVRAHLFWLMSQETDLT